MNATCYSLYTCYLAVIGKIITPSTTCITCPRSAPDSSPVHVSTCFALYYTGVRSVHAEYLFSPIHCDIILSPHKIVDEK